MRTSGQTKRDSFDPRTKIIVLLLCVLTATMSCSLHYECVLIILIAVFGCLSRKYKATVIGTLIYGLFYGFTIRYLQGTGTLHTMFLAWMGLFYKVYPCGMLAGIILSTTRINEFLSAMHKAHIPGKIVIPFAVMLRYIPTVREDWHYIKDAMRLRDVSPSLKGFLRNPAMTVECLYVPLMMAASKAADELAIASVTRGIENPASRTCLVQIKFRRKDIAVILLFLAVFLVNIYLKEAVFR
jgi:energy-coupling factor transporter transmembrane protein EcfT